MSHLRATQPITVSTTAILLLAANSARTGLLVQETGGTNDFTFAGDDSAVADGFGTYVKGGGSVQFDGEACPTCAIWAIRMSTGDATAVATETVG